MDDQVLWGLVLIVYIAPYAIWHNSEWLTNESRKTIYADRPNEVKQESRFNIVFAVWFVGILALLAAWKASWHPIASVILIGGILSTALVCRAANKRWNLMRRQLFRYWLASFAAWTLAVAGWFVIFGRESQLQDDQFILLAIIPPLVAAFTLVAWQWARKKP